MRRFSNLQSLDIPSADNWRLRKSKTETNLPPEPVRKRTQAEQDQEDDDARRKAMKDLVGSWNDRLQLISLITTFMASVEAGLLQVSAPDPGADKRSLLIDVSNACLISALIIHLHASFISFVGAFFLVRFKVKEAKREENKIEGIHPAEPSKGSVVLDMAAKQITNSPETGSQTSATQNTTIQPPVWSANPQLVQVGPFLRQPPIDLLSRCHFLCILCTVFGFSLAICGILCLAWARHPVGVRIAVTSALGVCLASGFAAVFTKFDDSHVFYG
ncbi:hypothetical protein L218DRAFT_994420 [Marasmius fiardii PR-910]|nr:hypothetical protein L218DRAFT_994420 [Marasmius fiardii PR-910]